MQDSYEVIGKALVQIEPLLYRQALTFTSCGVTIADASRPQLPLIYTNQAFLDLTGYTKDEVLGRNCRFLQATDRDQAAVEEIRVALRTQQHCQVVLRNYKKDGSPFWNELTVSPILDEAGDVTHFVGIQTDVTLRERSQRERERLLGELREAYRAMDDFAHVVSHDLKAPLRGIDTICGVLLDCYSQDLDPEAVRLLELLSKRSKRLRGLVQGVLAHSKIRRTPPKIGHLDPTPLLAEIIDLLDIPRQVELEIQPDLPQVQGDWIHLAQIFQNLIANAVQHAQGCAGEIEIGGTEHDDRWTFWVRDDGPGIPERHQERIFGIFERLGGGEDSQESTSPESPGIGLAIVKSAVGQLGGRVWIESEPGHGATFFFEWPKETD